MMRMVFYAPIIGVGGVIRDVLGVSAKPIAATDVLCFGLQDLDPNRLPEGVLHPRRIQSGVVAGVQDYGNKIGIPTVNGAILYDDGYTANPLVFCGCVGLAPKDSHPREARPGDRVIVLGGRTGRDGLRGATFSSMTMDAQTGEVLVMASHPGYDPNKLDSVGPLLATNKDAPLLNRAAQGAYPVGTASSAFSPALGLPDRPAETDLVSLYRNLGFYTTPDMRMPVAAASRSGELKDLQVSPLQMALAAAAVSNGGTRPAPRIALAVDTPTQGWVILPALDQPTTALPKEAAELAASQLAVQSRTYWQWTGLAQAGQQTNTWFIAGTLPNWKATPLALALLLEGDYPLAAQRIGQSIIQSAIRP